VPPLVMDTNSAPAVSPAAAIQAWTASPLSRIRSPENRFWPEWLRVNL
jgi:hypothetical protein